MLGTLGMRKHREDAHSCTNIAPMLECESSHSAAALANMLLVQGIDRPGQRRPSKDYSLSVISLERVSLELVKRRWVGGGQPRQLRMGEGWQCRHLCSGYASAEPARKGCRSPWQAPARQLLRCGVPAIVGALGCAPGATPPCGT